MSQPTSIQTRTDYLGPYTAYIYDDGHVETDPPGRPVSRLDAQRIRRVELATGAAAADAYLISRDLYLILTASETMQAYSRITPDERRTLVENYDTGVRRG